MSSTLPPPPPPRAGSPEYLDSGSGGPLPPESAAGGSAVRKGLLAGGAAIGLGALGVGAWAAYSFFSTGPQPAEALPAKTLGYVSIDLDPSGGQKIEALRTLNKFPAFKDKVGINGDDDIRKAIFDGLQGQAHCAGLDYADDIEPWLGDRAAFAAVDVGDDHPDPVVVLQVKDADKADAGLTKLKDCGDGADVGWKVSGDWAVVAESDSIAGRVVAAAAEHSLADDEDFKKWTGAAGDPGVMTMYAGPAAGAYLADDAEALVGRRFGGLMGATYTCEATSAVPGDDDGTASGGCALPDSPPTQLSDDVKQKLRDFKGAAVTVRFDGGAIELEAAGDSSLGGPSLLSGGGTADVVQSLPSDTAAVLGLGFKAGWFQDLVDAAAPYAGEDPDQLMKELSDTTGLDLPADAEALAGDSAALAVGPDFDWESLTSSEDGSDVPIALKIKGDPDQIEKVLDKLRDQAGPDVTVLESDSDGDLVAIGPDADYRAAVLKDGGLGDNHVFKDVIRKDDAQTVLFVDVDELEAAIPEAAGDSDEELLDNLKPVSGFGISAWVDGDVTHAVVRLATN